jgi:hypothetical protein
MEEPGFRSEISFAATDVAEGWNSLASTLFAPLPGSMKMSSRP